MSFIPDVSTVLLRKDAADVVIPEFEVAHNAAFYEEWKRARCRIGKKHPGPCEKEGNFQAKDEFLARLASDEAGEVVLGRSASVYFHQKGYNWHEPSLASLLMVQEGLSPKAMVGEVFALSSRSSHYPRRISGHAVPLRAGTYAKGIEVVQAFLGAPFFEAFAALVEANAEQATRSGTLRDMANNGHDIASDLFVGESGRVSLFEAKHKDRVLQHQLYCLAFAAVAARLVPTGTMAPPRIGIVRFAKNVPPGQVLTQEPWPVSIRLP